MTTAAMTKGPVALRCADCHGTVDAREDIVCMACAEGRGADALIEMDEEFGDGLCRAADAIRERAMRGRLLLTMSPEVAAELEAVAEELVGR